MSRYLLNLAVDNIEIAETKKIVDNYYIDLFDRCYYINKDSIEVKKAIFENSLNEIKYINKDKYIVLHFIAHGVVTNGESIGLGFLTWKELSQYLVGLQNISTKIVLNLMGVCYSSTFSFYSGYNILWSTNTKTNDIDFPMKIYSFENYDFKKYREMLKNVDIDDSIYNYYKKD